MCRPGERDRPISPWVSIICGPPDRSTSGKPSVVAGKHVLAVEAAEGTDQMLARVAEMRANGRVRSPAGSGVLVKAPKSGQDRRFDLPSIGPQTVEGVARAGLAGIAVVAGATIVAEPAKLMQAADRANIFVIGTPAGNQSDEPAYFSGGRRGVGRPARRRVDRALSGSAAPDAQVFRCRRRADGGARRVEPVSAR